MTHSSSRRLHWVLFWVLVALAVGVHLWLYANVNPTAGLRLRVTRAQAQEIAAEFLAEQGITPPAGYQSVVTFDVNSEGKNYLERTFGLAHANSVAQSAGNVFRWEVRWFALGAQDEYYVDVDPDGRVIGFWHDLPDDAPAPASQTPQETAHAFMTRLLGEAETSTYVLKTQSTRPRPQRQDYDYMWEREHPAMGEAKQRVSVTVTGGRVINFARYLHVPDVILERYARETQKGSFLTSAATALTVPFLVAALVGLLIGMTRRTLHWRRAALIAGIVAVIDLLNRLNALPLAIANIDTAETLSSFWTQYAIALAVGTATNFFLLMVLVVAAEWVYRHAFPAHRPLHTWFTRDGISSPEGRRRVWLGYGMIGLHLGYVTLFYYLTERWLGGWSPSSVAYDDLLGTAMPWWFALLIGASAAVMEEFLFRVLAISWLKRWVKWEWLAIVIPAVIWAFLHCNYPNQPYFIRGIELTIWGCVFGYVFTRFGPLPVLIAHAGFNAIITGEWFLGSTHWTSRLSFAFVVLAVLIPLALAYWPRRKRADAAEVVGRSDCESDSMPQQPSLEMPTDDTPFSNAEFVAQLEVRAARHASPAPLPEEEPPFTPLPHRAWLVAGIVLVIGIAAGLWGLRSETESHYAWKSPNTAPWEATFLTREQAITRARAVVRDAGGKVRGWKMRVYFEEEKMATRTDDYLQQYLSSNDVTALALRVTTPPQLWSIRWQRPLAREAWTVRLLPDGRVWDVRRTLPEEAPGPSLSMDEARTLAEAALRDLDIDVSQLSLTGSDTRELPHRSRQSLTWELRDLQIGEAQFLTRVVVDGGRVNHIERWIEPPESYLFAKSRSTTWSLVSQILSLVLLAVLGTLWGLRYTRATHAVPWRWGGRIIAGIAVPALVLVILSAGRGWTGFDATTSPAMHMVGYLVALLAGGLLALVAGWIVAAVLIAYWPTQFATRPGPRAWWRACVYPRQHAAVWRDAVRGAICVIAIGVGVSGLAEVIDLWGRSALTSLPDLPAWLLSVAPPAAILDPLGEPHVASALSVWWPPLFAVLGALLTGYVVICYGLPLLGLAKQAFYRPQWCILWLAGMAIVLEMSDGERAGGVAGIFSTIVGLAGVWLAWTLVVRWTPLALPVVVMLGMLIASAYTLWWCPPYRPFTYAVAVAVIALVMWALLPSRLHAADDDPTMIPEEQTPAVEEAPVKG